MLTLHKLLPQAEENGDFSIYSMMPVLPYTQNQTNTHCKKTTGNVLYEYVHKIS